MSASAERPRPPRRFPEMTSPELELPEPSIPEAEGALSVPDDWDSLTPDRAKRSVDEQTELGPEDVARRDATTKVFENEDGTETVRLHAEPVHFQPEGSTSWEAIDNSLIPDDANPDWVRNAANDWTVRFGPITPGGGGGVVLETDAGVVRSVPELATGANAVEPVVGEGDDADTVTYEDVWPGVDVRYTVTGARVKEDIVVADGAQPEYPFIVEGLGLTEAAPVARASAAPATAEQPTSPVALMPEVTGPQAGVVRFGRLVVADGDGELSLDSGASARVEPYAAAPGASLGVENAAPDAAADSAQAGAQRLVVSVDPGWLADQEDGDEPVVVDPTFNLGPISACTYGLDGEVWCDGISTGTNRPDTGHWWMRSVAQFNYRPYVETREVLKATLHLNEAGNGSTPYEELIHVWDASESSFGGSNDNGNLMAHLDMDYAHPGGCFWGIDVCFDVTGAVEVWQYNGIFNGSWDPGYLGFTPDEEDYPDFLLRNSYKNYNTDQVWLDLDLNTHPPVPTLTKPDDGALAIDTLTPTLKWNAVPTDADGDALKYNVKIATAADGESGLVATSPDITGNGEVQWTVPDGVLRDGVTYHWKVFANDTKAWTASAIRKLTVDRRLGGGGVSPTDGFSGVITNLVTGNASLAVSGPRLSTVGGGIGVDFVYNGRPSLVGLQGTYREDKDKDHNVDPEDLVKLVRTDTQLSLNWGDGGSPASGAVPTDYFLANWSGTVRTPAGNWQLGVRADDGTRIWIDDVKVLDRWAGLTPTPEYQTGSVTGLHKIQFDYYEHTGPAFVELWARNAADHNQAFVVPADWLSPDTPDMAAGWSLQAADANASYTRANVSEGSIALTSPDGSASNFSKQPDGAYKPPAGVEDVVTLNGDGKVLVHDDAGLSYVFRADGGLESIVTALDDRRPAAAKNDYDGLGRLSKITDPVSGREVTFKYAAADGDSSCPNVPPLGSSSDFESEEGMLCRVSYWDDTSTDLYYFKTTDLLSHIANPGDSWFGYSYDPQGRITKVADPMARDVLWAGARSDSDVNRLFTQIAYTGAGTTSRVQSVTTPAAMQTDTQRPQRTYAYTQNQNGGILVDGTATVTRAGVSGTHRGVKYDFRGRGIEETNAVGKTSRAYWTPADGQTASETPDGLLTSTFFNNRHQPTEVWGPAPKAWFDQIWYGADVFIPKPEHAAQIPHSITRYDEATDGLDVKWWNGVGFAGPVKAHQYNSGSLYEDFPPGSLPEGVNADNITGRFTGDIVFPTKGAYTLQVCAGPNDIAALYIDDRKITEVWAVPDLKCSGPLPPGQQGNFSTLGDNEIHRIRVDFVDLSGDALLHLNWTRPGNVYEPVPGSSLRPGYGLPTSTVDADGKTTKTEYTDPVAGIGPQHGLVTRKTVDPGGLNFTETTTYEPAGGSDRFLRRLTHTLPSGAGSKTTSTYYGNSEQRDNPCTTAPDSANQAGMLKLEAGADPDGTGAQTPIVAESVYDKSGRVVATRTGSEPWSCVSFDGRGRPLDLKLPAFGGQPARTVTNNYKVDPDGSGPRVASPLVVSTSDLAGTITNENDLLGRGIVYKDVFGNTTTFSYDVAGREQSSTGPVGNITKTWDNADRLTSLSRGGSVLANSFVYDNVSRLKSVTYPSGSGNAGNGTKGTFDYDANYGSLKKVTWTGPGGALLTSDEVSRTLGGDIVNQITDNADHHAGNDYTYDAAGRLVDAWVKGRRVQYDYFQNGYCSAPDSYRNGDRTGMTVTPTGGSATQTFYCYDHADRLAGATDSTVRTIAYDGHGNTTSIFGETHTYDSADRHMSTTKDATTVGYVRDATGRIVERRLNGSTVARYGSTGSGDAPDFTTITANVVQEVTYSLPGGTLLTTRGTGNVWSYPNTHGDVVATANQSGGKQGATSVFDPYGLQVSGSVPDNSAGNFDYAWLGQHQRPLEHENGLQPMMEMGARQYSPLLGRFLEVDPVEGGSLNDYDYVAGDPINGSDLDGSRCRKRDHHKSVQRTWTPGKKTRKSKYKSVKLTCGNDGYGKRHIKRRGHFGGEVNDFVMDFLIATTITARDTSVKQDCPKGKPCRDIFEYRFHYTDPAGHQDYDFAVKVVVNQNSGRIVTAYVVDRELDKCTFNWDGVRC